MLVRAAAPYVIAVLVVGGALFGAYRHGVNVATDRAAVDAAALAKLHSDEVISWQGKVAAAEHKAAENMAVIGAEHQKEIENEKTAHAAALACYESGTCRLRQRFTWPAAPAIGLPSFATSASQRDGREAVGLQSKDVSDFIRIASDADQVADQLRACQAVVRADRVQH